ncbi:MAG: methyltransferase domain-containing protein [Polaribacter sp.]
MKYLNLGCGSHYCSLKEWINIDFSSVDKYVKSHNLLEGIPCKDNTFDATYHSHVLEHFSKEDGAVFVKECFRVLKKGGVLRIVIPDLERIAKKYLHFLEKGIESPSDKLTEANYEWMKIEMLDQVARHKNGGNMIKVLSKKVLINEEFIFERIGEEGKGLREQLISEDIKTSSIISVKKKKPLLRKLKYYLRNKVLNVLGVDQKHTELGKFRLKGEIHQWMYDRYSLTKLLEENGGIDIEVKNAFSSYIPNWENYNLDGENNITRKPDSLFIECKKG